MLINFNCNKCGTQVEYDSTEAKDTLRCRSCGEELLVPTVKLSPDDLAKRLKRLAPGDKVGGFRIERLLNTGGMGTVFVAHQISMQRDVALKVLSPSLAADVSNVERFLAEVRNQAQLDHPNIVTAFEAGYEDGLYYLAMALVDGESLDSVVKRSGPLSEIQVLTIARAVADALAYAWNEHKILHRDIKPSNLMLDRRGAVKILDLGISKSITEGQDLTASGFLCGTPQYMSPEQARGARDLDCRSDIYSLGAAMYHLATGRPPFEGEGNLEILNKHLHEPALPPNAVDPGLTDLFVGILADMLHKDPEKRPQTWQDVRQRIDEHGEVKSGQMPAPIEIKAAPSPQEERTGWQLAGKGMLWGCAGTGAGTILVALVLMYLAFSVLTTHGCGCKSTGSMPRQGELNELRRELGSTFSMDEQKVSLGPHQDGSLWMAENPDDSLNFELKMRLVEGEKGGIVLLRNKVTHSEPFWTEGVIGAIMIAIEMRNGGQSLIISRAEAGKNATLHIQKLQQTGKWVDLLVTTYQNRLIVTADGVKTVTDEMFAATNRRKSAYWGLFAAPDAKMEFDFVSPKPNSTSRRPSDGGTLDIQLGPQD